MQIAVAGAAGRMGSLIIKKAIENGINVSQAFDIVKVGLDVGEVAGVGSIGVRIEDDISNLDSDILVDFTTPEASIKNAKFASEKGVKLVIGTTGFNELQQKKLLEYCEKVPTVISPNFSVGVNVFWKIAEFAAKYLYEYDIEIMEIHHKYKKDSPSGTALKVAEIIKKIVSEKSKDLELKFCRHGISPRSNEIGVFGIRGGDVVGEHTVYFFGSGERIEITHRALSRECFANGAIIAVKWINNIEKPGVYSMNDVLGF